MDWKETVPDQWGITDDGYVAQCLGRKAYTDRRGRTRELITFSFGRVWVPTSKQLLFKPFHEAGIYGGTSPRSWAEQEATKARTRRAVHVFVLMVTTTGTIDWGLLGRTYRPDQLTPEATVRRLFKQDRIQAMVHDELRRVLAGQGITEAEVIKMYRAAFGVAAQSQNASAMRAVARDLGQMLDMSPKQRPTPRQHPLGDFDWDGHFQKALEGMPDPGDAHLLS
ncbi:MAG: hypothetical protein AAGI71_08885 [Bacteroidota bacterium]